MEKEYKLEESLGFLSGVMNKLIGEKLIEKFRDAGYDTTINEWIALTYLAANQLKNQQHLAEATRTNKTAVTRLLNEMEDDGLVVRKMLRQDRRNNLLQLTAKGNRHFNAREKYSGEVIAEATASIDEADLKVFYNTMHKIIENLKK